MSSPVMKKNVYGVIFLLLVVCLCFGLPLESKTAESKWKKPKGSFGLYAGWSFSTDPDFYRSWYRNIHFLEGVNYQLGAYYEFPVKKNFSLNTEVNIQNFYSKVEVKAGYPTHQTESSTTIENDRVINLTLNALFIPVRQRRGFYYLMAGAGIGIGKTSLDLFNKTHLHFQAALGRKLRLARKVKLNIQLRMSIKLRGAEHRGSYLYYPGFLVGLEF